jgi:hypothetical protein
MHLQLQERAYCSVVASSLDVVVASIVGRFADLILAHVQRDGIRGNASFCKSMEWSSELPNIALVEAIAYARGRMYVCWSRVDVVVRCACLMFMLEGRVEPPGELL